MLITTFSGFKWLLVYKDNASVTHGPAVRPRCLLINLVWILNKAVPVTVWQMTTICHPNVSTGKLQKQRFPVLWASRVAYATQTEFFNSTHWYASSHNAQDAVFFSAVCNKGHFMLDVFTYKPIRGTWRTPVQSNHRENAHIILKHPKDACPSVLNCGTKAALSLLALAWPCYLYHTSCCYPSASAGGHLWRRLQREERPGWRYGSGWRVVEWRCGIALVGRHARWPCPPALLLCARHSIGSLRAHVCHVIHPMSSLPSAWRQSSKEGLGRMMPL